MTIADLADGPACQGMAHRKARTVVFLGAGLGPGLVGPERTCPLLCAWVHSPCQDSKKGRLLHRPVCEGGGILGAT